VYREEAIIRFEPLAGGGLTIQSWKDSQDSMVYPDGRRANPPSPWLKYKAIFIRR
jgi:hypothetical protein